MEQTKYDVFISYSRKDYVDERGIEIVNSEVANILKTLKQANISFWFDKKGIKHGEDFGETILKYIKASKIFIYLSTVEANRSEWTRNEIACALMYKKKIIPVRIDDSPFHDSVMFRIAALDYINYYINPKKGREEIIDSVKRYMAEEVAAARREEEEQRRREEQDLQRRRQETLRVKQQQAENLRAEIIKTEEECSVLEKDLLRKKHDVEVVDAELNAKLKHLDEKIPISAQPLSCSCEDRCNRRDRINDFATTAVGPEGNVWNAPNTYLPSAGRKCNSGKSSKRSIWSKIFCRKKNDVFDNEVYSSIFAPAEVKPKSHMQIQVFIHLYEETEKVKVLAQESNKNAERRDYIPLQCKLKKGDKVDVLLIIYGELMLMSDRKSVIWQGSFTKCSFDYFVPKEIDVNELSCKALLSVNDIPVGEMRFITKIVESPRKLNPEIIAHKYNKVFISYSHQDESKIRFLHEGLAMGGVPHFFDRSYLKPGDIFPKVIQDYINTADLFVLCWSENAAQSEYVKKERIQALERAYPKVQDGKLSIYPMSIEPRADLPSDMKDNYHFGDI